MRLRAFADARRRFDVRFYLVAILFIIFDLEVAFLFPWAVSLSEIGVFGFLSMLGFLGVLTVGFIYEWCKGALDGSRAMSDTALHSTRTRYPRPAQDAVLKGNHRRDRRQGVSWCEPGQAGQLGPHRQPVADDFRPGLLARVEMIHAYMPRYDLDRLGIIPRASPRQSDVMIVAGTLTNRWPRPCARSTTRCRAALGDQQWAAAPMAAATTIIRTRWCAAAIAWCRWTSTCRAGPPTAEALVYGIMQLQKKIRRTGTILRG